jgi:hypothetical protein
MGHAVNERRSDIEPLRAILHRAMVRYLSVGPRGFLLKQHGTPRPTLDARILSFGGARTLYKDRRPECRSLDGIHSASHTGRRCAPCEKKNECTPQVRIDLLVDARAFRLLLAHTSARNFLAYEGDLRVQRIPLDQPLHRLEVVNRGSWGEVRFSHEAR